ncbi:kinase-like domain-containing protein [Scheffersomyces coipomensis]|uniref:kinase-like domain-containing protein n=1 Tax=Scheffersomyces coipomensis TaxID=1788519 RepID=UPI00315E0015
MTSTGLFHRTEVIGRGKFGIVYKGFNKQTKQVVAIKVLNLDTEDDEVADVQQEIQFLAELKNVPNVTHYYGSFLNDTKLWIIMDYCAGGSLRTLLKAGVFEERYVGIILRELLLGLSGVHKMGFIHRDLKAANVLITKEGKVQLCDFGVAAKITSNALKRTTMAGTPYWMAPEVIRKGDTYNSKADIWSLGITIYEIATGNPPYCDRDADWAMQMISKSTPPRLEGREYSPALKECIALCLDENPEERPSADDLMKCKLVKLYKSHPRNILKEVISRYLLWRDKNPSRDSVYINLDKQQENENIADNASEVGQDPSQIQVKWDFDSLSSKEYIIENDINFENQDGDEEYDENDYTHNGVGGDTYSTLPTLQAGTNTIHGSSLALHNNYSSSSTLNNMGRSGTTSEIPKSLQSLFEDTEANEEESNAFPPPLSSMPSYVERIESPTIEIPDMDNLSNFNTTSGSTIKASSVAHPVLNKPPVLYHSQSASANLESRFSSTNSNLGSRQRKNTVSNTIGGQSQSVQQPPVQSIPIRTPHTPPFTNNSASTKTPSPKIQASSALLNSATNSNSPSKSMKALQANSNPLLQPINFKQSNDGNNSISERNALAQANSKPLANSTNAINGAVTSVNSVNSKTKKPRPGFRIQMPTPSNSLNPLSALTNEPSAQHDENVNQFGINPSQMIPLAMTPVTEKEPIQFPTQGQNETSQKTPARERTDSLASRLGQVPPRKPSLVNGSSSTNLTQSNIHLARGNSIRGPVPEITQIVNNGLRFPTIPSIGGELFIDTGSKQKLLSELDTMIRLFNQGLEALESNL